MLLLGNNTFFCLNLLNHFHSHPLPSSLTQKKNMGFERPTCFTAFPHSCCHFMSWGVKRVGVMNHCYLCNLFTLLNCYVWWIKGKVLWKMQGLFGILCLKLQLLAKSTFPRKAFPNGSFFHSFFWKAVTNFSVVL